MCKAKTLIKVVALLGVMAILLWLVWHPILVPPQFTIVNFSIPQSSIVNKEGQNGTVLYTFEIENPNSYSSIYYDDIFLKFYFGEDTVGEKRIPAFHQRQGMISHVNDNMDANPRVWKSFLNALISNAPAELKVGLRTRIQYKTFGKKRKHHKLDLQGLLPVGSDGKLLDMRERRRSISIKLRHLIS